MADLERLVEQAKKGSSHAALARSNYNKKHTGTGEYPHDPGVLAVVSIAESLAALTGLAIMIVEAE